MAEVARSTRKGAQEFSTAKQTAESPLRGGMRTIAGKAIELYFKYSPTSTFTSGQIAKVVTIDDIQKQHGQLVKAGADPSQARQFQAAVVKAGENIKDPDERSFATSVSLYWSNEFHNPSDPNIKPFKQQ